MTINGHELPDSANVLGTEYKIFYSTEKDDSKLKDCKGYTELCAKEIHLDKSWFGEPYFKGVTFLWYKKNWAGGDTVCFSRDDFEKAVVKFYEI